MPFLILRDIQQRKLCLSSFQQHGVPFSLIVAETDILPINVPVARFQLPNQLAFGITPTTQQLRRTHIESQRAKKQAVSPEFTEHGAEL